MKNLFSLFFFFFIAIHIYAQSPVEKNGALSVTGNKILNKNGDTVSLAGNSLFWSNTNWGGDKFYTKDVVKWLVNDWNTAIIRVAMGVEVNGGYLNDVTNKQKVKTIVNAAIENGIYVIIDWHSHHAEDYQNEAITFFKEMAQQYGKYENVIYEIYNEPLNNICWSKTIKPYAEAVINSIRTYDPDNLIVVGSPSWSQNVDIVSLDPITKYKNIAYSLHFYAGSHGDKLRQKAQKALDNGIALMVTEWGTVNADGDGKVAIKEVEAWMKFIADNQLIHCNWAVNNKKEGASILKPNTNIDGNWSDSDLTESGVIVKDIIKSWDK
ncbi:glycoside hydrolase family 5 protein [Plebeiibacterium sediminum]|uniref:Glycoside hydrolase family 5 protein n=1 Tax=Plebeiibacterium sediminum TaxID=2992112 RepID=A0AAE3SHF9_9BACT|nr:glycoside hydrolase family 5 protein [Plebeiobacterium sediminum]MCW3789523.1 glycoside hydrolase family 5 protein [Plebeiobacterium sediminum]